MRTAASCESETVTSYTWTTWPSCIVSIRELQYHLKYVHISFYRLPPLPSPLLPTVIAGPRHGSSLFTVWSLKMAAQTLSCTTSVTDLPTSLPLTPFLLMKGDLTTRMLTMRDTR